MSTPVISAVAAAEANGETKRITMLGDLTILTKARLSLMVVFTTGAGYCLGANGNGTFIGFCVSVLGTALAAASAAALNQVIESDVDKLMERTRTRPLPAGRMSKGTALRLGVALGILGVGGLWITTSLLPAILSFVTILVYLFAYTPLKRRSAWCTLVGAVSGAIPPVIGWAASGSRELWPAGVLFGILFFWQIPHFLAIAWMYKDEYAGAGFIMLKPGDTHGTETAMEALCFALALAVVTFIPLLFVRMYSFYTVGAGFFNLLLCGSSVGFLIDRSRASARRLFFMSIIYLPAMLLLLMLARKN